MYFDALTLAAVVDQLRETIVGGRIQRVRLPSEHSVALEIYARGRRRYLLLSTHPQLARVHLVDAWPSRGAEKVTPLLLLLRKYVVGGRVTAIEQPDLERVMVLSIVKGPSARNTSLEPDDSDADAEDAPGDLPPDEPDDDEIDDELLWRGELIAEVMERRANVVLVNDDNIIMESARHVSPKVSRRPVGPRQPYELPPRQEKRDPRKATPEGLRALYEPERPPQALDKALVGAYRGLSPQAAREVAMRATGSATPPLGPDLPWARLALALRQLWEPPWQPTLAVEGDALLAFAPYRLSLYPEVQPQPTISAALERYYAQREQLSSHQQRRDALLQALDEARSKLERLRRQLESELAQVEELERLRWEGEMILGFLHAITPGQTELRVEERSIALNPSQTGLENAQERFRAYDKAKGALASVPELLRACSARLEGLAEFRALLVLAESYEQIADIGREAVEQGYLRDSPQAGPKARRQAPLRVESPDGYAIYVGRSARQNEQVTFTIGGADDLWLHVRGRPGAHVIIKSGGAEVPEATLLAAAGLAAYYSQARDDAAVEVDISRRRGVRRMPDGPTGLVNYRAERTLRVAPRPPG